MKTSAAALARRDDPITSHQAAFNFSPKAKTLAKRICEVLERREFGATTHQIADILGESLVSVSPRMKPLADSGQIRDSGTRDKSAGVARIVWQRVGK